MKYLLDTNICIFIIKNNPSLVLNRFKKLSPGEILLSSITLAELRYGVEKSHHKERNSDALEEFILPLEIASFDDRAAHFYGVLQAQLEKKGTPIGPLELMIASHAQSLELILVTNNIKEFSRVPRLPLQDWTQPKI
jgi:tRNA(fMet)-specific endonuclease VapC